VRECPDFDAEKGVCPNRGCKLPHVIRASNRRKVQQVKTKVDEDTKAEDVKTTKGGPSISTSTAEAGAAEEYIALTFEESDEEEEEEEEESEDGDEDEDGGDEDAEGEDEDDASEYDEEGDSPTT